VSQNCSDTSETLEETQNSGFVTYGTMQGGQVQLRGRWGRATTVSTRPAEALRKERKEKKVGMERAVEGDISRMETHTHTHPPTHTHGRDGRGRGGGRSLYSGGNGGDAA